MLFKQLVCLSAVVAVLSGCGGSLGQRDLRAVGTYRTFMTENVRDGSMRCVAKARIDETLGLTGLECKMDVDLTFHFTGALEFQDVRVSYKTIVSGDWGIAGDTLRLMPDSATLQTSFIGSNASNNVEEAMVRQLRRNVIADIQSRLRAQYAKKSRMTITVLSLGEPGILGSLPDSSVILLQRTN